MSKHPGMVRILAISMAGISFAADPIGKVVAIEGRAHILRANAQQTLPLKVGSGVFLNDRVLTGEKAKLRIRFTDDSEVALGEQSEMVIDAYVYNPQNRKANGYASRFLKGVFRLITGKITELNPERFRASTRMATIGIRGCELGFRIRDRAEDIYVVDVTEGQRIVIETLEAIADPARRVLTVEQSGVAVSLLAGTGLEHRPLTRQESLQLLLDCTPKLPDERPLELGQQGTPLLPFQAAGVVQEAASDETAEGLQATVSEAEQDGVLAFIGPIEPPPTGVAPQEPPPPTRVEMGGGPFSDWEWGLWSDGTVSYHGNFLTLSEWQAIVSSGTPYDLVTAPEPGAGQAGAYIHHAGTRTIVRGNCDVQVQINVGGGHRWGGSFTLSNTKGDALQFAIDLTVGILDSATGALMLPSFSGTTRTTGYHLMVNGTSYPPDTITGESVNGQLVRHTEGGPITGASGSFNFAHHGGAVRVEGVFGADLQANAW